jgi:hypothetical protein
MTAVLMGSHSAARSVCQLVVYLAARLVPEMVVLSENSSADPTVVMLVHLRVALMAVHWVDSTDNHSVKLVYWLA